jgi:hypothetical protein
MQVEHSCFGLRSGSPPLMATPRVGPGGALQIMAAGMRISSWFQVLRPRRSGSNPSIERTPSGMVRAPTAAAHVER